jgi:hypothetical protein
MTINPDAWEILVDEIGHADAQSMVELGLITLGDA